jgi:hypothetical protein
MNPKAFASSKNAAVPVDSLISRSLVDQDEVRRLALSISTGSEIELDAIALFQAGKASPRDLRHVNEHVSETIGTFNERITPV